MIIDLKLALLNLGGSAKLYRTLITGFFEKYSHIDNEIYELLIQRKLDDARRMAHSIKGLSGNIGVEELRRVALDLELDIKQYLGTDISDEVIQRMIETTWYEFSIVLGRLLPIIALLLHSSDEQIIEASQVNDLSMLKSEVIPDGNNSIAIKEQFEEVNLDVKTRRIEQEDDLRQLLKVLNTNNYELIEEMFTSFEHISHKKITQEMLNQVKEAIFNYEYDLAKEILIKGMKDEN